MSITTETILKDFGVEPISESKYLPQSKTWMTRIKPSTVTIASNSTVGKELDLVYSVFVGSENIVTGKRLK